MISIVRPFRLVMAALLALMWVQPALACAKSRVDGAVAALLPAKGIDQALLDAAILTEVNLQRCKAGLPALQPLKGLRHNAEAHSRWMAKAQKLSHDGGPPGLASVRARVSSAGMKMRVGAENIGRMHYFRIDNRSFRQEPGKCVFRDAGGAQIGVHSYETLAHDVVAAWMGSAPHRRNILDRRVRATGAAAGFSARTSYCGEFFITQEFAG